jgi:hypothetical protein
MRTELRRRQDLHRSTAEAGNSLTTALVITTICSPGRRPNSTRDRTVPREMRAAAMRPSIVA